MNFTMIGLHGRKHAGKDTVYERILELGGSRFHRFSVADPMKDSIAELFGVTLEQLDEWKNSDSVYVSIIDDRQGGMGDETFTHVDLTMRRFMERYGTEAHRGVFGNDFWLDFWLEQVEVRRNLVDSLGHDLVVVNTSVRFPNEAEAIRERGGVIWRVVGSEEVEAAPALREDGTPIPSEIPLPDSLVDATIDNSHRRSRVEPRDGDFVEIPDFSFLDDQIATLIHGGTTA